MAKNTPSLLAPGDLHRAMGLLTRLPLASPPGPDSRNLADSAWAWPLVGALLGAAAGLLALTASALGLPAPITAALCLTLSAAMTGALHEDGLADTFDGLWGGQDRARRLEIMRDSRIGSYGVLALGLSLLLRWSALTLLIRAGWILPPLIATGALSRAAMALLMARMPNARGSGLAAGAGRPRGRTALAALALALGITLLATGPALLPAVFWAGLATLALAGTARRRIGGQTGDILGASQQLAEIAALAAFASLGASA